MTQTRSELYIPFRQRSTTVVVYAIFALTGTAIGLPGTLLPLLTARWHLNDAAAGLVLLALFLGSSAGSLLARGILAQKLVTGCILSAASLVLFLVFDHAAALIAGLYGLGLGTAMTSISLLQSRRRPERRAKEMATLNLVWALGALAGPVLLLKGSAQYGLRNVLLGFASMLAAAALAAASTVPDISAESGQPTPWRKALRTVPAVFLLLIPLSTGIESGVGSWLTTYSTRTGNMLNMTISTVMAFWAGFLVSRLLIARTVLGNRAPQWLLARTSPLLLTGMLLLLLRWGPLIDASGALLVGFGVGPLFPLLLALQLERGEAGNIGFLTAGFGAALLPLLTGAVSQWTHSLRAGMGVLFVSAVAVAVLGRSLTLADQPSTRVSGGA